MEKVSQGFTLIELLVTLAVAGVLLAVGVPGFTKLIKDNRLATSVNELAGSFSLARMEAVRRGARVVMCKSDDQSTCSTSTSVGWRDGWLIFIDKDADDVVDSTGSDPEPVVQKHAALDEGVTVSPSSALSNRIRFRASGRPMESGSFTVCDDRQGSYGRMLQIDGTGRVRLLKDQTCS